VDIDRFLAGNQPVWDRLDDLTRRGLRGTASLSAAELDELVRLYQRASGHLSYVRTYFADPALVARLTTLVGRSGTLVYGTRPRNLRNLGRFFTVTFPAAVWDARRFVLASAFLTLAPAVAIGVWLANSPKAIEASGPAALRQAYVSHDFASYYSSQPSAQFAAQVTTNNIQVAFLAFAGGILLCGLTVFILLNNGANVGYAAGLFAAAGQQSRFYGLILPHGLLELSSVVVAGGAGLSLGWALRRPHPTRASSGDDGVGIGVDLHRGRHHRRVRHGFDASDRGTGRHRRGRGDSVCDLRGCVRKSGGSPRPHRCAGRRGSGMGGRRRLEHQRKVLEAADRLHLEIDVG
jgi:uncharacterized membrane protein SpoIIM required for sporulation